MICSRLIKILMLASLFMVDINTAVLSQITIEPDIEPKSGIVQTFSRSELGINGKTYKISPFVKVYDTIKDQPTSLVDIKPEMYISFETEQRDGVNVITEIWIEEFGI